MKNKGKEKLIYPIKTKLHCPRCGKLMRTNYKGLTEALVFCEHCGLLAKWKAGSKADMLTWDVLEVKL